MSNATPPRSAATTQSSGTAISFDKRRVYNTKSSPASSNFTIDLTDARIGIVQKIYHQSGTEPTYPAEFELWGTGEYVPDVLNIIFCEWDGESKVEYWIVQKP